jgi:hypothetical protein
MANTAATSPGTVVDVNPIIDSYSESNADGTIPVDYSGGMGHYKAIGQSFTGDGGTLNISKFYLKKVGSPTGSAYAQIYAHSGTFGSTGLPTGSLLATSDSFDVSTLTTSSQLITFTFSGGNKITLVNGTHYFTVFTFSGVSSADYPAISFDGSSSTHSGNAARLSSIWNYDSGDICFYVYSDAPGTVAWSNPDNAKVSDNVYATVSTSSNGVTSHYLKATNFSFSIPTGATINGIVAEVEKKKGVLDSSDIDNSVKLVKGGTISGTDKASSTPWPNTDTYTTYGSSSDLWGLSLTPSDINDTNFGVAISSLIVSSDIGVDANIDHIRITVYYTEAPSFSPFPTFFTT